MSRVIVTKELAREGLTVMRGKDWTYPNQDVTPGNKGKIIRIGRTGDTGCPDGWARVKWENGGEFSYRIGYGNNYDLYIYVPDSMVAEAPTPVYTIKAGDRVRLKSTVGKPYSNIPRGEIYTVSYAGTTLMNLKEVAGAFEMKYFEVLKNELKGSRFKVGEKVFVKDPHDKWILESNFCEDVEYTVCEVYPDTKGSYKSVRLTANKEWWIEDSALMSRDEWLREPKKDLHSQIDKLRTGLSEIETKSNFKPNTNTNDEHRRNNNNPSTAIKVRRASWVIKGPEKRTRTFF